MQNPLLAGIFGKKNPQLGVHNQSIEYSEHEDQPQACLWNSKNAAEETENAEHAIVNEQREDKQKKQKIGKGRFVRGGFGWRGFSEIPGMFSGNLTGKKKVYTTTVETLLFFFFRVWGSMVYTLLSGPMVYTLFPCFPRKMVYTTAFFALWPRGRVTAREKRGATVVVYTLFSLDLRERQCNGICNTRSHWKKAKTRTRRNAPIVVTLFRLFALVVNRFCASFRSFSHSLGCLSATFFGPSVFWHFFARTIRLVAI